MTKSFEKANWKDKLLLEKMELLSFLLFYTLFIVIPSILLILKIISIDLLIIVLFMELDICFIVISLLSIIIDNHFIKADLKYKIFNKKNWRDKEFLKELAFYIFFLSVKIFEIIMILAWIEEIIRIQALFSFIIKSIIISLIWIFRILNVNYFKKKGENNSKNI